VQERPDVLLVALPDLHPNDGASRAPQRADRPLELGVEEIPQRSAAEHRHVRGEPRLRHVPLSLPVIHRTKVNTLSAGPSW